MRTTYVPSLRAPADWIYVGGGQQALAVPRFDEDEATMAVAAAEDVLERASLSAVNLGRVAVVSRTLPNVGATVALALGVPGEKVSENPLTMDAGLGPVLTIQTDAPRPGRAPPDHVRGGAAATATLAGPGVPEAGDRTLSAAPVALARDEFDRLAHWELDAPGRTTMGAYVPRAVWARSAPGRYRLEGSECGRGHVEFPPRARCGRCGEVARTLRLGRQGIVESFTVVARGAGPSEFEPLQEIVGEYSVAIAAFGPVRVPGLMTETPAMALHVGLPVQPVFRRLFGQDSEWRYGAKFRGITP